MHSTKKMSEKHALEKKKLESRRTKIKEMKRSIFTSIYLIQYNHSGRIVFKQECFCFLGNIWQWLEIFLVVTNGQEALGTYWIEARNANFLQCM